MPKDDRLFLHISSKEIDVCEPSQPPVGMNKFQLYIGIGKCDFLPAKGMCGWPCCAGHWNPKIVGNR